MMITAHAATRWCERVNPRLTPVEAVTALRAYERAVDRAAAFGCECVKLGCGARLVLKGDAVVTVLGRVANGRRFG